MRQREPRLPDLDDALGRQQVPQLDAVDNSVHGCDRRAERLERSAARRP